MNVWIAGVELWITLPLVLRQILIGLTALVVATQINRAIDRFAFGSPGCDAWSPAPSEMPRRHWSDRLPIIGWWFLRREAEHHGRWFWIRPLLIELIFPLGLIWLYYFELTGGLYPENWPLHTDQAIHAQFFAHAVLIALMTIATSIDFDEKTIPDQVTLLGTTFAVLWFSWLPIAALPTVLAVNFVPKTYHVILTTANSIPHWTSGIGGPQSWPLWLNGHSGFAIGAACVLAWWLASIPKIWTLRRGLLNAWRFAIASILRYRTWRLPVLAAIPILIAMTIAYQIGGDHWQMMLSSLIGMAVAGGFTWCIRLIASHVLKTEALGFGDVTLMSMLGAFLGWQAALMVFFLAPVTAVVVAIVQWLVTRRNDIAFGPYLCLAALVLVLGWRQIWHEWAIMFFSMGWILPIIIVISLVLLGIMLRIWQAFKRM